MTAHRKPEQSGPFECAICGAAFEAESDYREHLKNHAEQRKAAGAGVPDPGGERELLAGEQGQTNEERREWKYSQAQAAKEKTKSHTAR